MFSGIPKYRIAIIALALAGLWILKPFFVTPKMRFSLPLLSLFLDLLALLLVLYLIWKLFCYARKRLLWKISRRLIMAHIFIGLIPVILVIVIFFISARLFYYQMSYYLISNQIGIHSSQIHALNLSFREGLQELISQSSTPVPRKLQDKLDADAQYLLAAYPSASITLSYSDPARGRAIRYVNRGSGEGNGQSYQIPRWLGDREFSGLVLDDTASGKDKRLFLRSFVSSEFGREPSFSLEVSVPFDRYLLDRIKAALGQNLILAKQVGNPGIGAMLQYTEVDPVNIIASTFNAEGDSSASNPPWPIFLFPVSWSDGSEINLAESQVLVVELSTAKLMQNLFRSEGTVGKMILGVLQTLLVFFLLVVIASFVIGFMLTKSITSAVHNLDRGTEFVKRGDFNHRIVVRSEDQLGALAASFNQMTEYVQHLVKELVQKERLERELEIAKEVQERLFPTQVPKMNCMDVAGVCLPARTVSGDYYDFLPFGVHELGLALGDICGKGISAALLMANLQATLRSNVFNIRRRAERNGERIVAEVVENLNSQIYAFTAANRFATFFYAVYDDRTQTFTYCNAGHNPPLFFNGNRVQRLSAGGTVVGVFEDSKYDQETIGVKPGDLLAAYTDGIVESVNEYGEEYGESRLARLIQENGHLNANAIIDKVISEVLSWTFAEELEDDMTLIIAKVTEPREVYSDN